MDGSRDVVTALGKRFAGLWDSSSSPPDVFRFLNERPQATHEERAEVLLIDQARRWESGDPRRVEDYLSGCPEAAAYETIRLELTVQEFRFRQRHGEAPQIDEFKERFPELGESLHEALQSQSPQRQETVSPQGDETVPESPAPSQAPEETIVDSFAADHEPEATIVDSFVPGRETDATIVEPDVDGDKTIIDTSPPQNTSDFPAGKSIEERTGRQNRPSGSRRAPLRLFGDYELIEEIARGGMGVVYKARQPKLNRIVALKMILAGQLADYEDVQRFYTEAESVAHLDHPNIIPIYEVGQHDEQHFYSMGYIGGPSLAEKVAEGPLPPRRAAELLTMIADAIQYAHERGVIHRDLKPANVLLDETGQAKVTDFGLAKKEGTESNLTATGQIIGTPSYMPPEQAAGKIDEIGPLSDIYSLGAILYCLITGRPPFQAASILETLKQVERQEPVPPRQLNPAVEIDLETICLKCLSKNPAGRYASARDFADDLTRFLSHQPVRARPVGHAERLWRWCRRNPFVAGSATMVFVTLVAATIISWNYAITAERNAREATRHAAEAARSFRAARSAVDDLFTQVSEDTLLNQPGMQPLRQALLKRALNYYQQFLQERSDDPTVRDDLAATLFRVGVITEAVESPQAALASYQKALSIQELLLAETPEETERLAALGNTLNAIGRARFRSEDAGGALEKFQQAVTVREKLVAADPENSDFNRTLANGHMNIGLIKKELHEVDEAQQLFERAQQIRIAQLQRGDDPKIQRDLAMGYYNLGTLNFGYSDISVPQKHFEAAVTIFEKILQAKPRDIQNQSRLAISYRFLGDLFSEARNWTKAIGFYEKSRGRIELLALRNPDVSEYRANLAGIQMALGELYHEKGLAELPHDQNDFSKAKRSFQQAQQIREQHFAQHLGIPKYQLDLAKTLRSLGILQLDWQKWNLARENLLSSRKHLNALTGKFPENKEFQEELFETEGAIKELDAPRPDGK